MQEEKRISINDFPKWFQTAFLFIPAIGVLLISLNLNNDFYFLYPTGEYIVHHGFPTTDFLSMHTSMHIIVQQWLSTVVFYYLYSLCGKAGILALIYLCYLVLCILMYRFCMTVCNNHFVACVCAGTADLLLAVMAFVSRPQIFTYLILLAELLLLEKYVQSKKIKFLFVLPVLSLLLINLHASMWLMFFVFALPYGAAAIPLKFKKFKQEPCCSFAALAITGAVCFAVGFLNPYGFKAMTYLFTSYGYSYINNLIIEMTPVSLGDPVGYVMLALLGAIAVLALTVKQPRFSTRFVLLFAGTLVLALMAFRSVAFFFIAGFPAVAYMLGECEIVFTVTPSTRTKKEKRRRMLLAATIVCVIALTAVIYVSQETNDDYKEKRNVSTYAELDEISDIIESENVPVTLYTGFDWGPYMEFKGYHPYIDCRAELFLKDNNGEYDYMEEYCDVYNARLYYRDFVDKYNFNYLVLATGETYLDISLSNDDDFEELYRGENCILFAAKDR